LGVPADRDHREEVDEGGAVLPEVEDFGLDLVVHLDGLAHGLDGFLVDVLARRLLVDVAAGRLEEAAVLAEDLSVRVAGEDAEVFRGVHDRSVGLL